MASAIIGETVLVIIEASPLFNVGGAAACSLTLEISLLSKGLNSKIIA